MKASDVLKGISVALDEMAKGLKDPIERVATESAATILRAVNDLLGDKTPEECARILEQIRDKGTTAITADELVDRAADAVARAKAAVARDKG